jgi:hypothetical protein
MLPGMKGGKIANYTDRATAAASKLVPTFAGRWCCVVSAADHYGRFLFFSFKYPHDVEWTPFQTHYYPKSLVAPVIEPETSGSVARNSDH